MINVFLDLDGVVVNFKKKLEEVLGIAPTKSLSDIDSGILWKKLGEIDRLFLHLEPMPNYRTLFDHLKRLENEGKIHLEILTSLPYSTDKLVTSKEDKIAWVRKYLDKNIKVNTVVGGAKKAEFVKSSTDVLIDDLDRNINAWKEAGGIGILFKNNADAIVDLSKVLEKI